MAGGMASRRRIPALTTSTLLVCLLFGQCHRGRQIPLGSDSVDARDAIALPAYDAFVRSRLSGVFPLLAAQVVSDYGITDGRGLHISFGPPYLAIELAYQTDLAFDVLVADTMESALSALRIEEVGLASRMTISMGRADHLPFDEATFDLVLARDALRFWKDKAAVFREIDRVLKPGGVAFLGAGLGSAVSVAEGELIWSGVQDWRNKTDYRPWASTLPYPELLEADLETTNIRPYKVWTEGHCNCRTWVQWRKGSDAQGIPASPRRESETDVPAPDFTLFDKDGSRVSLADLRGEVIMLDFWAVNCRSCLNMMDLLHPVYERLGPRGCRFYAVNIDWREEKLDRFLEERRMHYPVLYDDAGVAKAYGIMGIPHFVLIDRKGLLRHRIVGGTEKTAARIEAALERLLGEQVGG